MVARRLSRPAGGLLAACRTGEPSFFDQGNLPVARVAPLSEEAATQLLAGRYPALTARVRRRLLDTALGNPLALLELPVSLGDLARPSPGPSRWRCRSAAGCRASSPPASQALPASVRELLLLAALDGTGDLRLDPGDRGRPRGRRASAGRTGRPGAGR